MSNFILPHPQKKWIYMKKQLYIRGVYLFVYVTRDKKMEKIQFKIRLIVDRLKKVLGVSRDDEVATALGMSP